MKKHYLLSAIVSFFSMTLLAQTKEDVGKIVENYDMNKIKSLRDFYQKKGELDRKKAAEAAKLNNWPLTVSGKSGAYKALMKLTPDGYPLYYSTENAAAAKSTRANQLHTGGSLGLTLNGENMVARVWDGGTVRRSHAYFTNRVTTVDDPTGVAYAAHATHVTGTIMASNANALAKGMAWQASARTFEWTDDIAEVLDEVQGGMLISNHSYGVPIIGQTGTPLPAWYIGTYSEDSRAWDEVAYNAPYYLMVASAGNNGADSNTQPLAAGFDKLTGNKVSKNNLVVANARDASVDASGNLTAAVQIHPSSSQGPSDDFRIKPDIAGNGDDLLSTNSISNASTTRMTGTSMASPNVAGTLLLLQQHYKNLTGEFMKAATLKGLACHTADEAGSIGPDATFGWGLLNAKKAAQAITDNGLDSWISQETLIQGQPITATVRSNGTGPLVVSITWMDVPGDANNGERPTNDTTPSLVNDLDVRVTRNGTTYYPWKLQSPTLAVRTGDNSVDNVEQVKIDSPAAGDYVITVSHKGTLTGRNALVNGKQDFSLVISGVNSSFGLVSTSTDAYLCANQNAVYTFQYKQRGVGTTTFSAIGIPASATANFTPASLSANGTVTMTVSGLSGVVPGEYNVGIVGNNGTETETRYKVLKIFNANFQATTLTTPANGFNAAPTEVNLQWVKDANAENYTVQLSTVANFASMLVNTSTTNTKFLVTGLNQDTMYYWRIVPSNRCGTATAASATIFSFKTGILVCGNIFNATDFFNGGIADTANSTASVPVVVTGGLTIGNIKVSLNLTHTYVQDMTIWLQGPASIGSPQVILFQEACGDNDDINCTLDDAGGAPACAGIPSISGNIAPLEQLSSLNGLLADGTWTLHVEDPYNGDGGTINSVSLNICNLTPSLGTADHELNGVKVYPNPTKGILNVSLPEEISGNTQLTLMDIQGRQILAKSVATAFEVLNIENLQGGVYMLSIENNGKKTTKKIVLNR